MGAESAVEKCRPEWLSQERGVDTMLRFFGHTVPSLHSWTWISPASILLEVFLGTSMNQWPAGVHDTETSTARSDELC